MAHKFLPARSNLPGGKPELRRIAACAVEWIDEAVTHANADDLVTVRTTCGDLHRVRAADLRAAFASLRRKPVEEAA